MLRRRLLQAAPVMALVLVVALSAGCACGTPSAQPAGTGAPGVTAAPGAAPATAGTAGTAGTGGTAGTAGAGGTSATAAAAAAGVPASAIEVTLLYVVDGDTIRVQMPDGTEEKVRYIGIDAPEVAHADSAGEYLGDEATAHNAELLAMGPLRLETDVEERDDFGRLLAYVWAGEVFVNERMVRDGYARAHNYRPNTTRQDQLWEAHDRAREAGIGIWSR